MGKHKYTEKQRAELQENVYVKRCGAAEISFTKDFKLLAIKQYNEDGMTPREIFIKAGLDLSVIGTHLPNNRLSEWNQIYKAKDHFGFREGLGKSERRVSKAKTIDLTDADRIKRLEATVAYLKAENSFLAKLRAMRRE